MKKFTQTPGYTRADVTKALIGNLSQAEVNALVTQYANPLVEIMSGIAQRHSSGELLDYMEALCHGLGVIIGAGTTNEFELHRRSTNCHKMILAYAQEAQRRLSERGSET